MADGAGAVGVARAAGAAAASKPKRRKTTVELAADRLNMEAYVLANTALVFNFFFALKAAQRVHLP